MFATKTKAGFLVVALAVNLVLASTLHVREARACSCAGSLAPERELRTSDAVFSGEVVSIEGDRLAPGLGPPLGRVTFDAKESWKGVSEKSVVVYGHGDEVSCGIDFEKGEQYLVYAYRSNDGPGDHLETSYCDATKLMSEAEADLRVLGSPTGTLPDTGGSTFLSQKAAIFAVSALAVLSLVSALVVRRARSNE